MVSLSSCATIDLLPKVGPYKDHHLSYLELYYPCVAIVIADLSNLKDRSIYNNFIAVHLINSFDVEKFVY